MIKEDLLVVSNYKKEITTAQNHMAAPLITFIDPLDEKNGLSLYDYQKNPYQDLHYEVAKKLLQMHMHGIEGIVMHYRGFTKTSDHSGSVMFPRLDDIDKIPIIIVEQITPIILHGAIPDHFIVNPESTYKLYTATKNIVDESTRWIIKDNVNTLNNNQIPFNAIIIFGDPNLLFFDTTAYSIDNTINIILPTLYIKPENPIHQYSNLALETLQYFKPLGYNKYTVTIEDQIHTGTITR